MRRNRAHFARNREARCVDLCHQHLSRQPKNGDSTFKVVYIIGTGNKDKLINMELDMQKKLKHEASGVEHGPTSAEFKKHYDANFIAYYLGTRSAVEQSQCYSKAKSPGLEMIEEALFEVMRRNEKEEDMDWTHGKVLGEKRPDIVKDPKDWHQELSGDRLGRFAYSDMGYDKL
ncbi:hypothetical protein E8E15_002558 [Penicillium rubens]|nr:hypothetical protein E8E15_002558 [Penicillium rubens]